jgi:hypothetical protein
MLFSLAWAKIKQKSRDTVPLKQQQILFFKAATNKPVSKLCYTSLNVQRLKSFNNFAQFLLKARTGFISINKSGLFLTPTTEGGGGGV